MAFKFVAADSPRPCEISECCTNPSRESAKHTEARYRPTPPRWFDTGAVVDEPPVMGVFPDTQPPPRTILLDLDGVVTDFLTPALRLHNRLDLLDAWPLGLWDVEKAMNMPFAEFIAPIDRAGASFWADLELYPHADELWAVCEKFGRTVVCTAPTVCPSSAAGKVAFLKRWRGPRFRDYIITQQKHLLGRPGTVLIDDNDDNCSAFREAGGHAIVFPAITNSAHASAARAVQVVEAELAAWTSW